MRGRFWKGCGEMGAGERANVMGCGASCAMGGSDAPHWPKEECLSLSRFSSFEDTAPIKDASYRTLPRFLAFSVSAWPAPRSAGVRLADSLVLRYMATSQLLNLQAKGAILLSRFLAFFLGHGGEFSCPRFVLCPLLRWPGSCARLVGPRAVPAPRPVLLFFLLDQRLSSFIISLCLVANPLLTWIPSRRAVHRPVLSAHLF